MSNITTTINIDDSGWWSPEKTEAYGAGNHHRAGNHMMVLIIHWRVSEMRWYFCKLLIELDGLTAITQTAIHLPTHLVKSLKLIWISSTYEIGYRSQHIGRYLANKTNAKEISVPIQGQVMQFGQNILHLYTTIYYYNNYYYLCIYWHSTEMDFKTLNLLGVSSPFP